MIGPNNDWSAGLASRFTIWDFGARRAELGAAQARHGAAEQDAVAVRQDVTLEVHRAYFSLTGARQAEQVARKALERAEDHLRIARARKAAGAVPQADVVRAQVEGAQARLALERAKGLVRIASGNLNTAMGLPVETGIEVDPRPRDVTPPHQMNLTEALDEAVRIRPEVKAAQQLVAASRRGVDAARSAFWPKVSAEAGFGWRDEAFFPNDKDWWAGASLEWSLFKGFSRKHKLNRTTAEAARQAAEAERLVQIVRREVWSAHSRVRENYEALLSTEVLVREAQEGLRLAKERYQAGAGTMNDLLDAETDLARAEATRVGTQWDYQTAYSEFQRSSGRLTGVSHP